MKIGPAVRPVRRMEKKGKDRTGQDSQKSHSGNISPTCICFQKSIRSLTVSNMLMTENTDD